MNVGDKALLFRNRDMMWLEESGSPSVGDKGFLVRNEDANFFLKGTSVSMGNKGRLFNINGQYYLRSRVTELGALKWSVNCSSEVHGIKVTSDGVIYAGTEWTATGGAVWAVNSDGNVKWCNNDYVSLPPNCPDYFTDIAISDDETGLFIGDACGYLRRFNTANGTEIWNWSNNYKISDFFGGLVIDSGDNIYGGGANAVVSVDRDGNFRWSNSTVGEIAYQLALNDNHLYVPQIISCNVSNQSKNYNYSWGEGYSTIDLNSGEINWIAGREAGYAVEYYNNRAYYGTRDELDCVTIGGGLIYRFSPIGYYVEDIVIDTNDNCYFFEQRGHPNDSTCIKKLDSDGNLIWTKNMTNEHCLFFGPHSIVIDNDNLYIATKDWDTGNGFALGIEMSTGNENWSYPLTHGSESGGALSPSKDTFYFGSGQYLYALET